MFTLFSSKEETGICKAVTKSHGKERESGRQEKDGETGEGAGEESGLFFLHSFSQCNRTETGTEHFPVHKIMAISAGVTFLRM